jgi:hypothetical protein
MKKRFTAAQIVGFLREAEAGVQIKDLVASTACAGWWRAG